MNKRNHHDDLYLDCLTQEGSTHGFLDSVFGFLKRKTNFFSRTPDSNPENHVKMLLAKHGHDAEGEKPKPILRNGTSFSQPRNPCEDQKSSSQLSCNSISKKQQIGMNGRKGMSSGTVSSSKVGIDDLVPRTEQDNFNGASCQEYSWSQTHGEIDIMVPVPENVTSSYHVRVFIRSTDLTVMINHGGCWVHKINGRLSNTIRPGNSIWTLHPGSHIHISLEKEREKWWSELIVGEDQIDAGQVDRSVQIEDLTPEAQSMVQKLAYQEYIKKNRRTSSRLIE